MNELAVENFGMRNFRDQLSRVAMTVTMTNQNLKTGIGSFFFLVALVFVYRSFYCMRIPEDK